MRLTITVLDFPAASFDVIYSRDCIIHIREKKELFERFFRWLKPGGRLMISGNLKHYDELNNPTYYP